MPAHNNRGIVTIRDVTRTAVAMERLGIHVSAEINSRINIRAVFCAEGLQNRQRRSFKWVQFESVEWSDVKSVVSWVEAVQWSWVSRRQPARIWAWEFELRESLESAVDDWEEMGTRYLAVAVENWTESSGLGSWHMLEVSRVESPAEKRSLYVCCGTVIFDVCVSRRLL
jgi:hypothetical protein